MNLQWTLHRPFKFAPYLSLNLPAFANSQLCSARGGDCFYDMSSATSERLDAELPFEVYSIANTPPALGFRVPGIDLPKTEFDAETRKKIELLMAERGFVVFEGQMDLSGDDQVRVSEYFGSRKIHSTHGVHPEAPNRHIFRLSNDESRGIVGVGPQWHNDGSFLDPMFSHVGYYSVHAPSEASGVGGETWFASTHLAYNNLTEEEKTYWSGLCSISSNGGVVHPVVYTHELTGRKHVYLHLGMTGAILDCSKRRKQREEKGDDLDKLGADGLVLLNKAQMLQLFNRYNDLLNDPRVHHKYRYRTGDLVVIDNLSVAHKADGSGHKPIDGHGEDHLRIVHRSTVRGKKPFHPDELLPGVRFIDMEGPNPFNADGVWQPGGLGFRWDESIPMQN